MIAVGEYTYRCACGNVPYWYVKLAVEACKEDENEHKRNAGIDSLLSDLRDMQQKEL